MITLIILIFKYLFNPIYRELLLIIFKKNKFILNLNIFKVIFKCILVLSSLFGWLPLSCLGSDEITTDTTTSTQPSNRPFILARQPFRILPLQQRSQVVNPFDIMLSSMNRELEIIPVNPPINDNIDDFKEEHKEEENLYVIPAFRSIITESPFRLREDLNLINRPLRVISNINGDLINLNLPELPRIESVIINDNRLPIPDGFFGS